MDFADLQQALRDRSVAFAADPTRPYTVMIVPSQTFDLAKLAKISGVAHHEEPHPRGMQCT